MSSPLHTTRPAFRLTMTLATALYVTLLTACGGNPSADATEGANPSRKASPALEWRGGDEHSFIAHRLDQEVVRCWNVQGKYDCLVAQSIGLKDMIPGAPGRLAFFRFRTETLPAVQQVVDELASSDGYACELVTLPGRSVIKETFWQGGRIIGDHASNLEAGGGWTVEDVDRIGKAANASTARPFFDCSAVIAPIRDVGLYAVDSGLIRYDPIFSTVDYPDRANAKGSNSQTKAP